jgi:thiol-disulfide isomerase/thioredoxin
VGTTHVPIVTDPSKDVLMAYFAPECGHCTRLEPIWEELAEHLANVPDFVIGKMDASVNEAEGIMLETLP